MHYHCEIIMPPKKDIGEAIDEILKSFYEGNEEPTGNEFYDWYVIGGRWAGTKETCGYNQEKIDEFHRVLREKKVTVSGVQCGKQTLEPSSQIPMVDELWHEFFPTENGEIVACPLFSHSNNQYDSDDLLGCDICLVEEIPESLTASRVIIGGLNYDDSELTANFMVSRSIWNGVNFEDTVWDGNVRNVLVMMKEEFKHYKEEYVEKITPKDNWLCVTVDYHS